MAMDESERFVERHQVFVWSYLRLLGCNPDEADDLAQEALVAALRNATPVREPRPFLKVTARNLFLAHCRRRARQPIDVAWLDAVDRVWAQREQLDRDPWLDALSACRAQLTAKAREVLELYYDEDLSWGEIGDRLGMQSGGVKMLLQRTRAALRECIRRKVE